MNRRLKYSFALFFAAVVVLFAACSSAVESKLSATSTTGSGSLQVASNWRVALAGTFAPLGWLDGVDCLAATSCVAVGTELSPVGPPGKALVETLSQGMWSASIAPAAPGSLGDYLFSVSCPVVGRCVAVGYSFSKTATGGKASMLIETLDNGKWTVTAAPSLSSDLSDSFLNAVSCATPINCVAVGNTDEGEFSTNRPLVLTLAAGTWSVTSSPNLEPNGGLLSSGALESVSCTSSTKCHAGGYRATTASIQTLVESYGGGKWSLMSSPGSGESNEEDGAWGLNGLSCSMATTCVAVGQLINREPILDVMNNGPWSATSGRNPSPQYGANGLYGVSCSMTSKCVAVGESADSFNYSAPDGALGLPLHTLIESNSSGSWSVEASPLGLPAVSGLHDVSCIQGHCVAVGESGQFVDSTSTSKTLIIETR